LARSLPGVITARHEITFSTFYSPFLVFSGPLGSIIIWLLVQPSHKNNHRTGDCFTDFLWIINTIQKMKFFTKAVVALCLAVADAALERSYTDDLGVTHTTTTEKPTIVTFAHSAVSFFDYGTNNQQVGRIRSRLFDRPRVRP
jgi:hypothetical protein